MTTSSGLKASRLAAAPADEDDLGRQVGALLERVVRVPDDLGRRPVEPEQVEQRAAGPPSARAAGRRRTGRRAASAGTSGAICGFSTGSGSRNSSVGPALLDVGRQVVDLLLRQRRRLRDEQHVEVGGDRRVGRDRADVVLLLQLGDDRPLGVLAHVRMSNPPISFASVLRMPTFLRALRETTRIDRVSSYSTGRPRSKNGMTTSSRPELNATPRMISSVDCRPSSVLTTRLGSIPNRFSALRALVGVQLGLDQVQPDPVAAPRGVLLRAGRSGRP